MISSRRAERPDKVSVQAPDRVPGRAPLLWVTWTADGYRRVLVKQGQRALTHEVGVALVKAVRAMDKAAVPFAVQADRLCVVIECAESPVDLARAIPTLANEEEWG